MAQNWVSFEEVKSRVSIQEVLTHYGLLEGTQEKSSKRGIELRLRCPFHEDKTPSLSISAETGKFHCFGCHAKGGDIFDFVVAKEDINAGDRTKTPVSNIRTDFHAKDTVKNNFLACLSCSILATA